MENAEIEKEILEEKKSISHLRTAFFIFLALVVAAFAYSYYKAVRHLGRQIEDFSVFDTRLQNIENAIPIHEKRIAKLEEDVQKGQKAQPASSTPSDMGERLHMIEEQVKSLKTAEGISPNTQQFSTAITLISSFHRLSRAIMSGKSFSQPLSSFEEAFGADTDKSLNDAVTALAPYSESGIPTLYGLLSSFDDAVSSLKATETAKPANAGFIDTVLYNLAHMVTIRKLGGSPAGNSADDILARAENDLENEEIEAAIAEIKSLPDNKRAPFNAWLEDAQVASITPSLIDQIEEKVMKKAFAADTAKSN